MKLLPDIVASLVLHVLGVLGLILFETDRPRTPPKVTYITAVAPPRTQKSDIPNRPTQREIPPKGVEEIPKPPKPQEHHQAEAMEVQKKPVEEVEPIKETAKEPKKLAAKMIQKLRTAATIVLPFSI